MPSTPSAPLGTSVTLLPSGSASVLHGIEPVARDLEADDARRRHVGQWIARMVHLQDRAVHVMAMLLHAAAHLAHVVVGQAHRLLPEGELVVAPGREQAEVEMLFGELHGAKSTASGGKATSPLHDPSQEFRRNTLIHRFESQFRPQITPETNHTMRVRTPPLLGFRTVAGEGPRGWGSAGQKCGKGYSNDDTRHHRHGRGACGFRRARAFGRCQYRSGRFLQGNAGLCDAPSGRTDRGPRCSRRRKAP